MDRTRLVVPTSPGRGHAALAAELRRVMPRDRWLLELLADHQTLTTDQIAAIAFPTLAKARRRLRLLYQRGLLDRFRHCVRPGSQSWRWALGPLGAALIAAHRDQPLPRPAIVRARTDRLAASPRLQHLLGVNQVFCALAAHARHHPGARLARWWPEARATAACGGLARPDGHGLWHADGRTVAFWLEYDTGTEPLHRLIDKLPGYAQLTATTLAYPVLFWLPTTSREHHLHSLLTRTPAARRLTIATASTQHADTTSPAGPAWWLAGRTDRLRLSALPTALGNEPAEESIVDGEAWDA